MRYKRKPEHDRNLLEAQRQNEIFYKAHNNAIVDSNGRQIAIVLASNCTKKAAREMAAYCAQQMNHAERQKERLRIARGE